MCETQPFTKAELAEMSDRECAALLESVAIGTGDVEMARICTDAVRRLRRWNDVIDGIKADSKKFEELLRRGTDQ